MAIERRVKPSARAKQALAAKKKLVFIAVAAVAVIIAVVVFAVTILPSIIYNEPMPWEKDKPVPANTLPDKQGTANPDAIKAMLEQTVSYNGTWVEDSEVGFQAYVPGTEPFSYKSQVSSVLFKNQAGTSVYGVVYGDALPSLSDDATADTGAVMEATVMRITEDVSQALYGARFSASYDVSISYLGDRTPAILVTGDLQTILGLQSEGSTDVQTITYNYPLCGVAFVRNNIPVMVWGVVDSDDAGEASRLPGYISECATILSSITVDANTAEEG